MSGVVGSKLDYVVYPDFPHIIKYTPPPAGRKGSWIRKRVPRGLIALLLLVGGFSCSLWFSLALSLPVMADTVLTLDVSSAAASVDLYLDSDNGTFASSDDDNVVRFLAYTTNETGYTLRLKSGNSTLLTPEVENGYSFSSISTITTQANFSADTAEAGENYNGKWGWKPNKYVADDTVITNTTDFLPAPSAEGTIIDITNTADGATATAAEANANDYTIALGVRAGFEAPADTYGATFVLEVVANEVSAKTITYTGLSNTTGLPALVDDITDNTIALNNQPYDVTITAGGTTLVGGADYTYNNSTGVITFANTQENSLVINAVYSITYNLDGGTNSTSNPATFMASDLPITLNDPTKTGSYVFGGWYETSDFSDTKVITIAASRYENVTLYAKWESSIKKYSNDCLTSLTSDYVASVNKDNINTLHGWTIKYKTYERYGSTAASPITSDEWLFLYAGPNTDPDTGQQDGENHIVLMTKYIANNIKYYSSAITNRATANTFTSNKDNWAALYALNDNDYAYGTVKSVRANSSATDIWAEINYRWYVGFGLFAYDKDETYSRSDYYAFGNNQSISRAGNSEYDSGIGYGTRPMVYLGTDKKITEIEDADYYGVIVDETVSTCSALGSDGVNGAGGETE